MSSTQQLKAGNRGPGNEIKRLWLKHNIEICCHEENNKRKRNYNMKDIATVSEAISLYKPTASREGNARQLTDISKAATGLDLKRGQAYNAIRDLSNDSIHAQIGQCMLLPSLFKLFETEDADGTYDLETQPCEWDQSLRQFTRCYVCLSTQKEFWRRAIIRMIVIDGTHKRDFDWRSLVIL